MWITHFSPQTGKNNEQNKHVYFCDSTKRVECNNHQSTKHEFHIKRWLRLRRFVCISNAIRIIKTEYDWREWIWICKQYNKLKLKMCTSMVTSINTEDETIFSNVGAILFVQIQASFFLFTFSNKRGLNFIFCFFLSSFLAFFLAFFLSFFQVNLSVFQRFSTF